jgi:hypothetical protein
MFRTHLARIAAICCGGALTLTAPPVAAASVPARHREPTPSHLLQAGKPALTGSQLLSLARTLGSQQSLTNPMQSTAELMAESCGSSTFCMAVGYYYYNGSQLPLSAKWNGTTWSRVAVPVPTGLTPDSGAELEGVSCFGASFCMAAGNQDSNDDQPLTLTWNGSTWTYLAFPLIISDPTVYSVSCPSSTECIVVGQYEGSSGEQGLVEDWTPTQGWEMLQTATLGEGQSGFDGVSCQNTAECMVVGYFTPQGQDNDEPLSELDILGDWVVANVPSGPAGYGTVLVSASCGAVESCVAVGLAFDIDDESFRAESYSWPGFQNGAARPWSELDTPQPGSAGDELLSVSCQTGSTVSCEAVGSSSDQPDTSTQTMAMSLQGTKWSMRSSPSPAVFQELNGVSCMSSTACTAVGAAATIEAEEATGNLLEATSATAQAIPVPTGLQYWPSAVDCVDASDCMMVGYFENGTSTLAMSQSWNGHKWTELSVPTPGANDSNLNGIDCTSATFCVAVGEAGFGSSEDEKNGNLRAAASARNGEFGMIATWNGKQWSVDKLLGDFPEEELLGVSCVSPSSCVAVGSGDGIAISYSGSGTSWTLHEMRDVSGYDTPASVACTSASDCEAVGDGLESDLPFAQHWNGSQWTLQHVPAPASQVENLSGVSCPTANACVAVGSTWTTNPEDLGNLILLWNGKTWATQTPPPPVASEGLSAVSCISPSSCLAVAPGIGQGSQGVILSLSNGVWTATEPTAAKGQVVLYGVAETAANAGVAVGDSLQQLGTNQIRLVETNGQWSTT